jgi:RNA polymerase sigma-70 factor (ECF subfamily)
MLDAVGRSDEEAFVRRTAPHRTALHRHCYRMLGSLHDADDATQETMLRAWRAIDRFEPRASLSTWLHRIATNVCLRMLEQRSRRSAHEIGRYLQPYPDQLLQELPTDDPGPAGLAEEHEAIGLAFVAALQFLPAKQRAVLLLRDVLGWSANETAEQLDDSVPAVNSALQRARERLAHEHANGTLARVHVPTGATSEAALMRRFQDAWAAVDIEAMVALLAPDAVLTMPPEGARFAGAAAIGEFFGSVPLEGRLDRITLVSTRANAQPALAAYAEDPTDKVRRPYGVMVFSCDAERIVGITGFPQPELFARLGLPDRSYPSA